MRRALIRVICLCLAISTLNAQIVPIEKLDGTYWMVLTRNERSQVLTGYLITLYSLFRVFENSPEAQARIARILPWETPPNALVLQIDEFYRNPSDRGIPLWMAVLGLRGENYERSRPDEENKIPDSGQISPVRV